MATIRTNENIVNLRLVYGETAIVEFQPEGPNAVPGSPVISFLIGMVALPGARMALSIKLPKLYHFVDERGVIYLLDDPNGASELAFEDPPLRVRRP